MVTHHWQWLHLGHGPTVEVPVSLYHTWYQQRFRGAACDQSAGAVPTMSVTPDFDSPSYQIGNLTTLIPPFQPPSTTTIAWVWHRHRSPRLALGTVGCDWHGAGPRSPLPFVVRVCPRDVTLCGPRLCGISLVQYRSTRWLRESYPWVLN